MKHGLLVALAAALGVVALLTSATASAQESVSVTLDSLEGFGITGSATLTETADGYTQVEMEGAGLTDGEEHVNHIHTGTGCAEGEYAGVVASLTTLAPSGGDTASASTTVEAADAGGALTFADITDGGHVLVIHEVDATPAACGAIPEVAANGDDNVDDNGDVAPPATGTGGYLSEGSGTSLALGLAALLLVLGGIGVGAGFAFRRA